MADRNFHTALLGGFRKKDVVTFLAEDKRRQTEELDELRQRVEALEQELDQARNERVDAQELEEQVAQAQQAQEDAKNMAEQARQAQTEARAIAQQARQDQAAAQALAAKERQAREEAERRLADSMKETRRLADQLLEEQLGHSRPASPPLKKPLFPQSDRQESAWRQNDPESCLGALGEEHALQLRDLCNKLERTLNQVERLLGGSYRIVCYPENPEEDDLLESEGFPQSREIPVPRREPPQERNMVGEILQRVRPRK